MNTSYLDGSWYIDEMKHRYNESAPVPFSLPQHKYAMAENDFIYVEDVFQEPKPIKQVIDFIRSDAPISRIKLDEQLAVDFIPTRTLLLPVNKENAVKSGIVKPEDAHLMVDTITINLQASSLRKSEMMLLDLLANFDWERPLYVTSPSLVANFGLQDYLQFDGYAYRLVPIKTTYTDLWNAGRIDTDLLYHNLMEVYRYGNVADPRVYVDTFVNYNFNATNIRIAFARLGAELADAAKRRKRSKCSTTDWNRCPYRSSNTPINTSPTSGPTTKQEPPRRATPSSTAMRRISKSTSTTSSPSRTTGSISSKTSSPTS